jgi:hypothetical protein
MAPVIIRAICATRRRKWEEWRCLSFREVRMLVTEEGKVEEKTIGSSETDAAEQACAAFL